MIAAMETEQHPNVRKIQLTVGSRYGSYMYRITYDRNDFPNAGEDWNQSVYQGVRRELTMEEQIKVVNFHRKTLTKFWARMTPEIMRAILSEPFS